MSTTGKIMDPAQILDRAPMNGFQIMAVTICILLNALDGFDVLAISFASPGIAAEWSISRAELGVVLAMELFGMAIGSITLGGLADRFGRRPTILLCLVLMTIGMYLASLASSVNELLVIRFATGLGIGGMLASTNAMVAEFSNAKRRNLAVILMAAGYPLGAIAGGSVATMLLEQFDWRAIFVFGAIVTGAFLLIVWFLLPESIGYLSHKQPAGALEKINKTLKKMGHEAVSALPALLPEGKSNSYKVLFTDKFRRLTLLLIIGYFTHIMTFYYILKWIPKIVVDMGYEASLAGSVLVWANVGGATGALVLGLIASGERLRKSLIGVLVLSFVMICVFGLGQESIPTLSAVAAMTGFFTNAGVVGFYALIASSFPAEVRASGTGIVIGIGRGGAALGPVIAGLLFSAGHGLMTVSIVMGIGALLAAGVIYLLKPAEQAADTGKA
ncbi:MFS transporter [Kordiimonas lipolytica]|uniref:MFS transporter n=1 Tax=Kordiimonas lipolytica TaxID=1662421 RepID=A0ABV8U7B7_9PROT|nr:MFS transporter [Kordiimonas lipolytica]